MASRSDLSSAFEPLQATMDKLPSSTLKRHPKMDLNKSELLSLLSYLEGELQARDISIAALKAEKAKHLLYQAKYGRFGLGDPFLALQRDSVSQQDNSFDETAIKTLYDNQLIQLENLIETQRRAQVRMREQLAAVEKRYHKVCAELEEEKRKHAQDTAQGDDVTYMLEKERERLKQELDFEKNQNKKLEKELKKAQTALEEETATSNKHKQVALMLIKERKRIVEKLLQAEHRSSQVEHTLQEEKGKIKSMAEGLVQESKKSLKMEAALEKQLTEFDIEREQLKGRLAKEEGKNRELQAEVLHLRQQLDAVHKQMMTSSERRIDGPQSIEIRSGVTNRTAPPVAPSQPAKPVPKAYKSTPPNTPPEVRRAPGLSPMSASHFESPERDLPQTPPASGGDTTVRRAVMHLPSSNVPSSRQTHVEKPIPAEKPSSDSGPRINMGGSSPQVIASSTGSAVFTTPTGTKISLNLGASPNVPRKVTPAGRGTPPPVPPNKPVYVPQGTPRNNTSRVVGRGDSASPTPGPGPKPQVPTKFGITITKDKITISNPEGAENIHHVQQGGPKNITISSGQPGSTIVSGGGDAPRKTSQLSEVQNANIGSPALTPSTSSPNSDSLVPGMTDLQQLLVTMSSGQSSPSSVDNQNNQHITSVTDPPADQLCNLAATGNLTELRRLVEEQFLNVNLARSDGTTPLYTAAQNGHEDCLQYLLDKGANPNVCLPNKHSAMHATASGGHVGCMQQLISQGGDIHQADQSGETPLFCAAQAGHVQCCQLLLSLGTKVDASNDAGWSPVHAAIDRNNPECLELLLTYGQQQPPSRDQQNRIYTCALDRVMSVNNKQGQNVFHLAAAKSSKDCLEVLVKFCQPDLDLKDRHNLSPMDVASVPCRGLLEALANENVRTCQVSVEVHPTPDATTKTDKLTFCISTVKAGPDITWIEIEEALGHVVQKHFDNVATGLKTKRLQRLDHEEGETTSIYSMDLSLNSVKYYSIGLHHWSPGTPAEKTPYELLARNDCWQVKVHLFGWDDGCVDALAYESLVSVTQLQNYLRLIEQYRNVIFFGPPGSGKTYLTRKLAFCLQNREIQNGHKAPVHFISCYSSTTCQDFLEQLADKGCLLPSCQPASPGVAPIIVLDDLSKVSVGDVFSDLMRILEKKGPDNCFKMRIGNQDDRFYLIDSCYIIGTMDRCKATGLELSAQQNFRWVQFRNDTEPSKHLLHRHLYRKLINQYSGTLPGQDDAVLKAVEWVICVWQRLNEGVTKLGLPDLAFGPSAFISCPVEANKPKIILRWLSLLWNHIVSPGVNEAVVKGSGSETSASGQQKVASTALYVLMQRAVVHGCPLTGQEKERYLAGFHGSNELEIKMRSEKKDKTIASPLSSDEESLELSWQQAHQASVEHQQNDTHSTNTGPVLRSSSASPTKTTRSRVTSGGSRIPTNKKTSGHTVSHGPHGEGSPGTFKRAPPLHGLQGTSG